MNATELNALLARRPLGAPFPKGCNASERECIVHQLSNGRWIVATWNDSANRWESPTSNKTYRATNLYARVARTLEALGADSYATRAGAVRRARREYLESDFA
jgi:hypothetical protein